VRQEQTRSSLFAFDADEYRKRDLRRISSYIEQTGGAPIEFDVTATGDDYLVLANGFLCVRAKIIRANGDNLDAADMVGPVNNFLHSWFS
jgi:hypothetical protein